MAKSKRELFSIPKSKVADLIKRRRLQMMVHSCLYYEMNSNLISDHQFDSWAKELADLLRKHPDAYSDDFDQYFNGWDGSSGYHLPHRHPWVYDRAKYLLDVNENHSH